MQPKSDPDFTSTTVRPLGARHSLPRKWPRRRTLLFILVSGTILWIAIALGLWLAVT
ncbi:MAG: hypothetical protein AB7S71_02275 [Dongiaceae bacterium]